jgi:hypothetical protein
MKANIAWRSPQTNGSRISVAIDSRQKHMVHGGISSTPNLAATKTPPTRNHVVRPAA